MILPREDGYSLRRFAVPIGGFLLVLALGGFMLYISWLRWPDLLIDFGREVYVPWRLSEGEILYKDIAYLFGPFSPYFNALWFKVFGISLSTLFGVNFVLILLTGFLIYKLSVFVSDRLTAWINTAVFVGMFAFGQYLNTGNYNFMAPYSHGLTHGFFLSLLFLYFLARSAGVVGKRQLLLVFGAGLAAGSAFLTKVEIAVAILGVAGVWSLWQLFLKTGRPGEKVKILGLFGLGLFIPSALFAILLVPQVGLPELVSAVLEPLYKTLFAPTGIAHSFNAFWSGFNHPWFNFVGLLLISIFYGLVLWLIYASAVTVGATKPNKSGYLRFTFAAAIFSFILMWFFPTPWVYRIFTPLPLLVGVAVVYFARRVFKGHGQDLTALLLSLFAFLLLLKILLLARVYHYGFVLALPALLVLVTLLFYYVPRSFGGGKVVATLFRLASLCLIIGVILVHVRLSSYIYDGYNLSVSFNPGDSLIIPGRPSSHAIIKTSRLLGELVGPDEDFIVIPEGVLLNYLTRIPTPSRYLNFFEVIFYGDRVITDLRFASPDYVVLLPRGGGAEYGFSFGQAGFGAEIADWVSSNYQPVGEEVLPVDLEFGVQIFKKVSS